MKALIWLACIAGLAYGGYRYAVSPDCGSGKRTFGFYDIGVVWTRGPWNEAAGLARPNVEVRGKRVKFSMGGMAIVVPPQGADALVAMGIPREIAASMKDQMPAGPSEAMILARIKAVATHEMGHALGLLHSDSEEDIMHPLLPQDPRRARASARDFRTVDALYSLPNGATLR